MIGIFIIEIGKVGLTRYSIGTTTGTRGFFSGSLGVNSLRIYEATLNLVSGAGGTLGFLSRGGGGVTSFFSIE